MLKYFAFSCLVLYASARSPPAPMTTCKMCFTMGSDDTCIGETQDATHECYGVCTTINAEADGIPFSVKACAETSEFKSSFFLQQDECYDFLDRQVWESMTYEPYPEEAAGITKMKGSFCGTNMCNVDEDACVDKMKARDIFENLGMPMTLQEPGQSPSSDVDSESKRSLVTCAMCSLEMDGIGCLEEADGETMSCDGYCAAVRFESSGFGFTMRSCAEDSEFKSSASIVEGQCYDLQDSAVWNSLSNEPMPHELRDPAISKLGAEFCSQNMCNAGATCGAKKARNLSLFGGLQQHKLMARTVMKKSSQKSTMEKIREALNNMK